MLYGKPHQHAHTHKVGRGFLSWLFSREETHVHVHDHTEQGDHVHSHSPFGIVGHEHENAESHYNGTFVGTNYPQNMKKELDKNRNPHQEALEERERSKKHG